MATLAFGSSVATPNGQALVAEAVVVENFDELYKLDPSQVLQFQLVISFKFLLVVLTSYMLLPLWTRSANEG